VANEIQLKPIAEDEFDQLIMGNVVLDGMAMNKGRVSSGGQPVHSSWFLSTS